jgi:hypothetical protein
LLLLHRGDEHARLAVQGRLLVETKLRNHDEVVGESDGVRRAHATTLNDTDQRLAVIRALARSSDDSMLTDAPVDGVTE